MASEVMKSDIKLNENDKIYNCPFLNIFGIISNSSVYIYNYNFKLLWNIKIKNLEPIDIIFCKRSHFFIVLLRNSQKEESYVVNIISLDSENYKILINTEFESNSTYISSNWVSFNQKKNPDNTSFQRPQQLKSDIDTFNDDETFLYTMESILNYSNTLFYYSNVNPNSPILEIFKSSISKNCNNGMLFVCFNKEIFVFAYGSILIFKFNLFKRNYDLIKVSYNPFTFNFKKVLGEKIFLQAFIYFVQDKIRIKLIYPKITIKNFLFQTFNLSQSLFCLVQINKEINNLNSNLYSVLDIEFIEFLNNAQKKFENRFLVKLLQILVYGSYSTDLSYFLSNIYTEKLSERLCKEYVEVEKHWNNILKLHKLMEIYLQHIFKIENYLIGVIVPSKEKSKNQYLIFELLKTLKTTVKNNYEKCFMIIDAFKINMFMDEMSLFCEWLHEVSEAISKNEDQKKLRLFQKRINSGVIEEVTDSVDKLVHFISTHLTELMNITPDSIFVQKVPVEDIIKSFKDFYLELSLFLGLELFCIEDTNIVENAGNSSEDILNCNYNSSANVFEINVHTLLKVNKNEDIFNDGLILTQLQRVYRLKFKHKRNKNRINLVDTEHNKLYDMWNKKNKEIKFLDYCEDIKKENKFFCFYFNLNNNKYSIQLINKEETEILFLDLLNMEEVTFKLINGKYFYFNDRLKSLLFCNAQSGLLNRLKLINEEYIL